MSSGQSEIIPPLEPATTTPAEPARPAVSRSSPNIQRGWFLGCLVLLLAFTGAFEARFRNTIIIKDPLPLKRQLSQLDRDKLIYRDVIAGKRYSYRLEGRPAQLQPEMIEALGTDQYVGWALARWDDVQNARTDEIFQIFITYYTGKPDQVPHVPEECMLGSGYRPAGNQMTELTLPDLSEKDRLVPVQAQIYEKSTLAGEEAKLVMYLFRANDEWSADRDKVRLILGNPLTRYAYFSKVELSFLLPPRYSPENVEQAIAAGKRFLGVALPVLARDHWPVWPSDDQQVEAIDGQRAEAIPDNEHGRAGEPARPGS